MCRSRRHLLRALPEPPCQSCPAVSHFTQVVSLCFIPLMQEGAAHARLDLLTVRPLHGSLASPWLSRQVLSQARLRESGRFIGFLLPAVALSASLLVAVRCELYRQP